MHPPHLHPAYIPPPLQSPQPFPSSTSQQARTKPRASKLGMPPLMNAECFHGDEEELKASMASIVSSSACLPITLTFADVCYRLKINRRVSGIRGMLQHGGKGEAATVEERTILDGVTGLAKPGELLAILGPSGSGKSTLLSVLAGRLAGRYTGTVLANGRPLCRAVLPRIGYVPQDDVLYPHLTVRETLVYCALLRLPRSLPQHEKVAAADAVIAELGLEKCRDTPVGSAFVRGVSGGERKRVSIAHEVLLGPGAMLLDEPTSGLDASAAHRMVAALAGMARRGRTVVAAVHQPSSRVFQMFDSVLLLADGRCLYFGRASDAMDYFASAGFVPRFPVNPADFMLDLANGFAQTDYQGDAEKSNVKQSLVTSYNRLLAPRVKASIEATAAGDATQIGSRRYAEKEPKNYASISWFSQFAILLRRSIKERRHETFNSLRVFQVMAAAVLSGAMWWHSSINNVLDRLGLLYFMSIFWGVLPSFNAVFTFPQERVILGKERASGMYSLSSYFMARMAGDLPMELILPTVFIIVAYWMAGLRPEFSAFVLTAVVLLGYVLVAQGLGLVLGAAIMDAKQASTVVTVTMLAFVLTGGFYVRHVPACLDWLKYTSFTFYCYRLLIAVQYSGIKMDSIGMLHQELDGEVSTTLCIIVLVAMLVLYRLLAYAALRRMKA